MPSRVAYATVADVAVSVDRALAAVSPARVGGVALFVGIVRDHDGGQSVTALDYSAHPLAASALEQCAETVAGRHDVVSVAVEHRVGHLEIGDLAMVVAVGAEHRAAALAACAELVDLVKAEVPVWKHQQLASGESQWVGS